MNDNKHEALRKISEQEEQNELIRSIDEVLYQHERIISETPNYLLLDIDSWHKLQSIAAIPENEPLIRGIQRGRYKGLDVMLVTDPYFALHDREPHGLVIMAGNKR